MQYAQMCKAELEQEYNALTEQFQMCKALNLNLNMSRGKPSKIQLDISNELLQCIDDTDCVIDGVDVRNYGEISGLPCAKAYWADVLGCKPEQVFVGGSSSLNLMYDVISRAYTHGLLHSTQPWCKEVKIKFLCPSPGYDRHFLVTQTFGAELITVPMTATGPDMDLVEELVKDPQVKGIWCVPKYSNPDGIIYSDDTIRRFASLNPAASDFVVMWDNAYSVHEFEGDYVPFPDIFALAKEYGNEDMFVEFASTSKITFAGAGISAAVMSEANIAYFTKLMNVQTISFDKINQLRHVRFLKNKANTIALMKRQAKIVGPKFKVVADMLDEQIKPLGIAQWNRPKGGYFISFNTMPGTAKRALALCQEAGVVFTPAGATFPYGVDPEDSNIRLAPSFPPVEELVQGMRVFCTCVKLAALEKLLSK